MSDRLSEEFHKLAFVSIDKDISIKELAQLMEARTQALLTLALSLPFLFFIPLPGVSIVFGIFILLNGFRIAARKKLWFPSFLMRKRISAYALKKLFLKAEKWALRIEKFIRPRVEVIHRHPIFERINGLLLVFCGFFLSLPLPPGTNFLPGLTTLLISLGILEEDGVCLIIGYFMFLVAVAFYITLAFVGEEKLPSLFT